MKQVLCFLLVFVVMIVSCGSYAEESDEFIFRNRIKFGISPEELVELEGNPNMKYLDETDHPTYVYRGYNLSGIKYSRIEYLFIDRTLKAIIIIYGENDYKKKYKEESILEDYKTIETGLTTKYGKTEEIKDFSSVNTYTGCAINAFLSDPECMPKATQRMLSVDDDHSIVIEHIIRTKDNYDKTQYLHYLSYAFVDLDEAQEDPILKDL